MLSQGQRAILPTAMGGHKEYIPSATIAKRLPSKWPKPVWHPPWRNYRVLSGHLGWLPPAAALHSRLRGCTLPQCVCAVCLRCTLYRAGRLAGAASGHACAGGCALWQWSPATSGLSQAPQTAP